MESKYAHIMRVVIRVNPPTKLFPIVWIQNIVILSLINPKVKAKLECTRMKFKNRCPAY
jgi:hypothetical protein